jgi:hypothetical protein
MFYTSVSVLTGILLAAVLYQIFESSEPQMKLQYIPMDHTKPNFANFKHPYWKNRQAMLWNYSNN